MASARQRLAFLVGPPRSGTTLLSLVLSKVPGVRVPPELWVALSAYRVFHSLNAVSDPASDRVLAEVALREALSDEERTRLVAGFLRDAYRRVARRYGNPSLLIDKTPRYYKILDFLAELLPGARFLLMVRHPLDVAASHKERWGIDLELLASPEGVCETSFDVYCAPRMLAMARRRLGRRAHVVRYEELVAEPELVLRSVCRFLRVPFSPGMLRYLEENPVQNEYERASLGDRQVWRRQRIDEESVGRWKRVLTENEVSRVTAVVGAEVFGELGYPAKGSPPPDERTRSFLGCSLRDHMETLGPGADRRWGSSREVLLGANLARWEEFYREAERLRANEAAARRRAEELVREAERQRDAERGAREAEAAARARAEELVREAERQRDAERGAREAEAAARARAEELVREAERQRDAEREAREAEADTKERWRALCHQAEAQRDRASAERDAEARARKEAQRRLAALEEEATNLRNEWERIERLWPWVAATSGEETTQAPLISIVTPSFNQAQWIEETIRSVLDQEYPAFEHIIVDGGSEDGTAEIVARYPHVRFVQEPDLGQAHAINKGMLLARGEIVAYLNSDDVYRPGAFRAVAESFQDPGTTVVVGSCDYIDVAGNVSGRLEPRLERYWDLLRYWGWGRWYCVPQQSVFWRRSVLAEVGLFDVRYQYVMDYEMWLRLAKRHRFVVVDQTLAGFRLQPQSKTVSDTWGMYLEEREASRDYWPPRWHPTRWYLDVASRRHTARKLLDVAEHEALSLHLRRRPLGHLGRAVAHWPPVAVAPRFALTTASALAAHWPLVRVTERVHRGFLHLLWVSRKRGSRK